MYFGRILNSNGILFILCFWVWKWCLFVVLNSCANLLPCLSAGFWYPAKWRHHQGTLTIHQPYRPQILLQLHRWCGTCGHVLLHEVHQPRVSAWSHPCGQPHLQWRHGSGTTPAGGRDEEHASVDRNVAGCGLPRGGVQRPGGHHHRLPSHQELRPGSQLDWGWALQTGAQTYLEGKCGLVCFWVHDLNVSVKEALLSFSRSINDSVYYFPLFSNKYHLLKG